MKKKVIINNISPFLLLFLFISIFFCDCECKKRIGIGLGEYTDQREAVDTYQRALYFIRIKDYDKALVELRKIVDYYPTIYYIDEVWYKIGEALFALKQYQEAIGAYKVVLKKYRDSEWTKFASVNTAICYKELKEYKKAANILLNTAKKYPVPDIIDLTSQQLKEISSKFPESKYFLKIDKKYKLLLEKLKKR